MCWLIPAQRWLQQAAKGLFCLGDLLESAAYTCMAMIRSAPGFSRFPGTNIICKRQVCGSPELLLLQHPLLVYSVTTAAGVEPWRPNCQLLSKETFVLLSGLE